MNIMHYDAPSGRRVKVSGKFLRFGDQKFFVKGFSYGPFAPNFAHEPLPEPQQLRADFAHMQSWEQKVRTKIL